MTGVLFKTFVVSWINLQRIDMKFFIISAFLFAVSASAYAQDAVKPVKKENQTVSKSKTKPVPLPADDKDPVCLMPVKKGTLITTTYLDKVYGFCSDHCKGVFLANPEVQLKPVVKVKS